MFYYFSTLINTAKYCNKENTTTQNIKHAFNRREFQDNMHDKVHSKKVLVTKIKNSQFT